MNVFFKMSFIIGLSITVTHRASSSELTIEQLETKLTEVIAEEKVAQAKTEALVAVIREREAEVIRLQALSTALDDQLAALTTPKTEEVPDLQKEDSVIIQRRAALVKSAADRLVLLHDEDAPLGTAFLGSHEGEVRIFAPAVIVSGHQKITVMGVNESQHPISTALSCPTGVDLVCLHPVKTDLPYFELASTEDLPAIGDPIVVILVDSETSKVTGVGGAIRGIGPDTWELDADLAPGMNGAPVLSLSSGKVIGVVTPQVAGVSAEWAIGTRHEENRSFAARIDNIKKWQSVKLDRFAKEAAYIQRISDKTRLAWLAHMLVEFEYTNKWSRRASYSSRPAHPRRGRDLEEYRKQMEEYREKIESERQRQEKLEEAVREEAKKKASKIQIKRVNGWLKKYSDYSSGPKLGASAAREKMQYLKRSLSNIYSLMARDLKDNNRNLSDKFTPYHAKQYLSAQEWRQKGIDTMISMQKKLRN